MFRWPEAYSGFWESKIKGFRRSSNTRRLSAAFSLIICLESLYSRVYRILDCSNHSSVTYLWRISFHCFCKQNHLVNIRSIESLVYTEYAPPCSNSHRTLSRQHQSQCQRRTPRQTQCQHRRLAKEVSQWWTSESEPMRTVALEECVVKGGR